MGKDLRKSCLKYSEIDRTKRGNSTVFKLHAEVF